MIKRENSLSAYFQLATFTPPPPKNLLTNEQHPYNLQLVRHPSSTPTRQRRPNLIQHQKAEPPVHAIKLHHSTLDLRSTNRHRNAPSLPVTTQENTTSFTSTWRPHCSQTLSVTTELHRSTCTKPHHTQPIDKAHWITPSRTRATHYAFTNFTH